MGEDLEGDLTGLTFQAIWVFYLCWKKMALKPLLSSFIHLLKAKRAGQRWRPGFKTLHVTMVPPTGLLGHHHPGSGVCLPALAHNTFRKKTQEVSPPAAVKRFERDINFITACGNIYTFNSLLHWVSHKSSKVFCGDGCVCLSHETVRTLSCTLWEYKEHGYFCEFCMFLNWGKVASS